MPDTTLVTRAVPRPEHLMTIFTPKLDVDELLRLGRRLAVCDSRIWTESPDRLAAQANVTYAIPG